MSIAQCPSVTSNKSVTKFEIFQRFTHRQLFQIREQKQREISITVVIVQMTVKCLRWTENWKCCSNTIQRNKELNRKVSYKRKSDSEFASSNTSRSVNQEPNIHFLNRTNCTKQQWSVFWQCLILFFLL